MINHQLICKVLGQLLFLEAVLLMVSLGVSIGYQEDDVFAFLVTIFITIGAGLALKWRGHNADNSMSRRDAYLVVSLAWIVFSFFGTFPFLISGYIHSFTDAYFETMSGFTTTGATILDDVECFPHGLLFWRSLTQWIGGLGIVFFTIALLPSLVGGQTKVFAAEATGPIKTKLLPLGSELHPTLCGSHQVQDQGSVQELGVQVLCILCHHLHRLHHGRADSHAQL